MAREKAIGKFTILPLWLKSHKIFGRSSEEPLHWSPSLDSTRLNHRVASRGHRGVVEDVSRAGFERDRAAHESPRLADPLHECNRRLISEGLRCWLIDNRISWFDDANLW
jgi:hypothetical protein